MIGKTLGHYEITAKLGEGGMGEVYRARDTKLDRDIAIKILPAALAQDPERLGRFEREAKTVAGLNHPHIVTLYSVERDGNHHYITMELVEGRTLSELIPKDGMALAKLLDLGISMADAIAAAHRKGITHRDLKPDNIMINNESRLKVLDFGLAKLQEDAHSIEQQDATVAALHSKTVEGKILGTPAYMSPEQAEGKPADVRSDIFATGIILYEMATGQQPFRGDTPLSTISSILRDTPTSVITLNRNLPRHLGRIVKRCLEKDPDRRYQTALDVKNELENLREEIASGEIEAPVFAPTRKIDRQHGPIIGLAVVAIASLAFGVSQWMARDSSSVAPTAALQEMEIRRLTTSGSARAPAISPDGRHVAYCQGEAGRSSIVVIQVATRSQIEIVSPEPETIQELVYSPDGDFVYYLRREGGEQPDLYRVPALGGQPRKVVDSVGSRISFSPGGQSIVFVRRPQPNLESLVVADLTDGSEEILAELGGHEGFRDAAWSPDGGTIIASRYTFEPAYATRLWEFDLEARRWEPFGPDWWDMSDMAWLPDGDGLVFVGGPDAFSSQVWHISYPGGVLRRITNDLNVYIDLALTADGRSLVTDQSQSAFDLWMVPLEGESEPSKLTPNSAPLNWPTVWMSDGTIIYTTTTATTMSADMWKLNVNGGSPRQLTSWPEVEFHGAVDPSGRYVVFSSNREGPVQLWRTELDGSNPLRLTAGTQDFYASIAKQGEWVYYVDAQRSRLMKVSIEGGEPLPIRDVLTNAGIVSPDGTRLAVNAFYESEGRWKVDIVPVDGSEPLATLDLQLNDGLPTWSSDGSRLLYDRRVDGAENVWSVSIDGGAPEQLTHFEGHGNDISSWVMSPDGKSLAVSVGRTSQDIVLVEDFR